MISFAVLVVVMGSAGSADSCERLVMNSPDDSIHIEVAQHVAKSETLPAFCQVQGTIEPNIGFEARLPTEGWNASSSRLVVVGFADACMRIVKPDPMRLTLLFVAATLPLLQMVDMRVSTLVMAVGPRTIHWLKESTQRN